MGHQAADRAARKQFAGHTAERLCAKAAMSIQVSSLLLRDLDQLGRARAFLPEHDPGPALDAMAR